MTEWVRSALDDVGYCHLPRCVSDSASPQFDILNLIRDISTPLHVYRNLSFWKPLPTDPNRPRTRSGGVGLNSLHMDCVNLQHPPDLIFFHCVRSDPAGGGTTLVCPTYTFENEVQDLLPPLSQQVFRDGAAYDLDGVGDDINPFPIFNPDSEWRWRYSGRILETITEQSAMIDYGALVEFDRIVSNRAIGIHLEPGDLLIVNQRLAFHGRLPMGPKQSEIPENRRRSVIQAYGRY